MVTRSDRFETASLTRSHRVACALNTVTGVDHLYVGYADETVHALLVGLLAGDG